MISKILINLHDFLTYQLTLKCSFMLQPYHLRGVINLKTSGICSSDPKETGHFTAICQRSDNSWIQYKNLKETEIIVKFQWKLTIIIIYYLTY